ncbi:hypothetical protein ACJX0J_026793 [Zea mays]
MHPEPNFFLILGILYIMLFFFGWGVLFIIIIMPGRQMSEHLSFPRASFTETQRVRMYTYFIITLILFATYKAYLYYYLQKKTKLMQEEVAMVEEYHHHEVGGGGGGGGGAAATCCC